VKPARLTPPAESELREATGWYRDRSAALARDFLAEVRRTLETLEEFPGAGANVPYADDSAIRRLPIRRFPYQVVYVELNDRLEVVAIAADRKRPGYWLGR